MMAEIVNLNRARKAKGRVDKESTAAANRAAFGRPKAEKQKTAAEKAIADRVVDAHKRSE